MSSTLALVFPTASFIYLLQNILRKDANGFIRILFSLFALVLFLIDVFVFLVFYVNCHEATRYFHNLACLGWIYPTSDFVLMSVVSLMLLIAGLFGLARKWDRKKYFILGSVVVYLGLLTRLFVLGGASQAISATPDSSNPVVFEIFANVIVYGLVSTSIYLIIRILSLFKR